MVVEHVRVPAVPRPSEKLTSGKVPQSSAERATVKKEREAADLEKENRKLKREVEAMKKAMSDASAKQSKGGHILRGVASTRLLMLQQEDASPRYGGKEGQVWHL